MKEESKQGYLNTREYRSSQRITFRYEGQRVELADREVVQMISPPPVAPLPQAGEHSGFWIEVHDAEGRVVFHRVLHNPIPIYVEEHLPDKTIRAVPGAPGSGTFEVLIPDMPEAETIVLVSSPLEWELAGEPARELARFRLAGDQGGKEEQR
jgi:hypothetical protein